MRTLLTINSQGSRHKIDSELLEMLDRYDGHILEKQDKIPSVDRGFFTLYDGPDRYSEAFMQELAEKILLDAFENIKGIDPQLTENGVLLPTQAKLFLLPYLRVQEFDHKTRINLYYGTPPDNALVTVTCNGAKYTLGKISFSRY